MKKQLTAVLALALLCGCSTSKTTATAAPSASAEATTDTNAFTAYKNAFVNQKLPESYSAAVNSTYKMGFSDNTTEIFVMDGTMEAQDATGSSVTAHSTQHISSQGTESSLNGWYYGGRLYNTYNNVNYYEDMSFSNLKKSLLVPMDIKQFGENSIDSITSSQDSTGNTVYTIKLKQDTASSVFTSRYDSYGLGQYDGYAIADNTIKDTFDKDGYFLREDADFTVNVTSGGQAVSVSYSSYVSYLKLNETKVEITDDMKTANNDYVKYSAIDTSKITTESPINDAAESTVEATFKKRLVGRLGYTDNGDNTYLDVFNTNEVYVVDFNNKVFRYTNYSITYTYSWKGDTGSLGACTVVFNTGATSTDCQDTTVTTIKDVKTYLQMELYYCGLSLDDLQAEA